MRIYLTGFMGSGKTTIGRLLAEKLVFPFYDLDQEIEQRTNHSISEFFQSFGEAKFRNVESQYLRSLLDDPVVISTGGGCFIHNREWMLQNGFVVYLKVPFDELAKRVGADPNRPLWRNAEKLFEERQSDYLKAQLVINADTDPDAVATQIAELITNRARASDQKIPGS